jgi:hypothetical protein
VASAWTAPMPASSMESQPIRQDCLAQLHEAISVSFTLAQTRQG